MELEQAAKAWMPFQQREEMALAETEYLKALLNPKIITICPRLASEQIV